MQAVFPDLHLSGLRIVNVGFCSTVIETCHGIIIRVAKTAAAARGHAVEAAVLPVLAPILPNAIPVPAYYCPPVAQLLFGAIGYQSLPGQQCQPDTATEITAHQLGTFLAALHRVDTGTLTAMPGPKEVWRQWHKLREDTEPVVLHRMTRSENQRLDRWWDRFLGDPRMQRYQPAVRHGDLWYGNLLTQEAGTISAVLDWEMVAIADPAQDLAMSRYLGSHFTQTVLDAYRSSGGAFDRETQFRADRHWELRELTGISLAQAVNDEDEINECISKLRAGPIFG